MRQIRKGEEAVLSDFDEDGFERAMGFFRPSESTPAYFLLSSSRLLTKYVLVIQGLADADVGGKLTQKLVEQTVEFCCHAFDDIATGPREMVPRKVAANHVETKEDLERLNEDERAMLRTIRARQILRAEDTMNINNFSQEAVDGLVPRLIRGNLGLAKVLDRTAAPAHSEGLVDTIPNVDDTVTKANSERSLEGTVRS
jgi:hypothetical protein